MLKKILFISFALGFSSQLLAHGDGKHHGKGIIIDDSQAKSISLRIKDRMLSNGKLSSSWKQVNSTQSIKMKELDNGSLWIVKMVNPSEQNKSQQNLYVFLGENGKYKGANHTGEYN